MWDENLRRCYDGVSGGCGTGFLLIVLKKEGGGGGKEERCRLD